MSLKTVRESVGLTQEALGSMLGVVRSTVAMWETGESFPRAELLPKIAKILNCTVDELLQSIPTKGSA